MRPNNRYSLKIPNELRDRARRLVRWSPLPTSMAAVLTRAMQIGLLRMEKAVARRNRRSR